MSACRPSMPAAAIPDPEPGVALALAVERARTIENVRYALAFDVPTSADQPITATAAIRFNAKESGRPLVLDFAPGADHITAVLVGSQRSAGFRVVHNHIVIPAAELTVGENVVEVAFRAGDAALNRNADFLYTLFVPARAHVTFPCFDQPDIKARYSLTLSVPAEWTAVANGTETSREPAGTERVRITYGETQPIPTYLFAFAAGKFQVESAERNGRTFRMFHRETDQKKVARNRDPVFDLHAGALAWLERYTEIPYPFGKFDFVAIPSFQFGGMEHPGAILYNASSLLLDESATENQLLERVSVIAHETSHMWFGDLVTMRWFDDVWMKEVFANFMAAKIVNPAFPAINHDLRFLLAHYPAAYAVDRTEGTHEIRQPLDNLSNAGSQYGPIIYQKAPIVMRQLERLLGEDGMRDGLRAYLKQFSFGNATWLDLVKVLDERSDRDLAAWSKVWVEEGGRPTVRTEIAVDATGAVSGIGFLQSDPQADRGLRWTQQMHVAVGSAGSVRSWPVELSAERAELPAEALTPRPAFVLPTGGGFAYGSFVLDEASRRYLLAHVSEVDDPVTRGAAWVTLWDEVLERRIAPPEFVAAALRALPKEGVQQNVQLLVRYIGNCYWRFLSAAARAELSPRLERALRQGLAAATTASLKSTYFSAYRSTASSTAALSWLERVWARKEKVPGLPLAEPDEAALALELAVRDVPHAAMILDEQTARFTNPDRKARFEFVRPALSSDAAVRDAWFATLADVANRRREPWAAEGVSYLNHPLRADASRHFVRPALDLLQDIQRTGDIFFPSNWMNATLNGHTSAEVVGTVRAFLTEHPDYPVRLRRIILQSADDVFRAAAIRAVSSPSLDR